MAQLEGAVYHSATHFTVSTAFHASAQLGETRLLWLFPPIFDSIYVGHYHPLTRQADHQSSDSRKHSENNIGNACCLVFLKPGLRNTNGLPVIRGRAAMVSCRVLSLFPPGPNFLSRILPLRAVLAMSTAKVNDEMTTEHPFG